MITKFIEIGFMYLLSVTEAYGGDGWTNQRTLFALRPFSIPKTFHPSAYSKLKQWQRDREQ